MDECWANTGDTCGWSRTTLLQLNQCFSFSPATLALNANNGRYNEDSVKYRAQIRASLSHRISSCHEICGRRSSRSVLRPGTFKFNAPGAIHGGICWDLAL